MLAEDPYADQHSASTGWRGSAASSTLAFRDALIRNAVHAQLTHIQFATMSSAAPADVKDDLLLQIRRLLGKNKPELQTEGDGL